MTEPTTNAEPFIVFELAGTAYGLRSRDEIGRAHI